MAMSSVKILVLSALLLSLKEGIEKVFSRNAYRRLLVSIAVWYERKCGKKVRGAQRSF